MSSHPTISVGKGFERREAVPLPDGLNVLELPSFCMTHVCIRGLKGTFDRIRTGPQDIRGINDFYRAHNDVTSVTYQAHCLINTAIDEYSVNYFHLQRKDGGELRKRLEKVLHASLTSGGNAACPDKLKYFAKFCERDDIKDSSLIAAIKMLCDVRDLNYHYEGHRYKQGTIPKTFASAIENLRINTETDVTSIGTNGWFVSSVYLNFVTRTVTMFFNILLSAFRHFKPYDDFDSLASGEDVLLLMQPFDAMSRIVAMETALTHFGLKEDELDTIDFCRCRRGLYFFFGIKGTCRGCYVDSFGQARAMSESDIVFFEKNDEYKVFPIKPKSDLVERLNPDTMSILLMNF